MPLIDLVLPGGGYKDWQWNGVHYGAFIAQVVNFLLIAADSVPFHREVPGLESAPEEAGGRRPAAADQGSELLDGDPSTC